jgi:Zn-finger protein
MMEEMIARCGFQCHLCPAFRENNKSPADQVRVAAGWSKYFGLDVPPEKIRCNGCLPNDSGGFDFPDKNCSIRPCVIERGLENCAYCENYPCGKLEERMTGVEEVAKRFLGVISQEEYDNFIAPYDARKILDGIRKKARVRRG